MRSAGFRQFAADEVGRLCEVVQPANRPTFEAAASAVSVPGRQSAAVLSLAYAFALVIDVGAAQIRTAEDAAAAWTQPREFTDQDFTELERHYSAEGAALEYEGWAPYWMAAASVFDERIGPKLVASARRVFDDQVDRWGAAEGMDLRRSVGAPDWSLIAFDENAAMPDFVDLLFEWGGRLRLGERFLAGDLDLVAERFGYDAFDPIDHFYAEAYQRYIELASQPSPPISTEIAMAVRMCAAWLGHDFDAHGRLAIGTAAVRAYLWRTVEGGPIDFLEPELTDTVTRSFDVGDDRSEDEELAITYYYAASQCMADNFKTRLGSIGGLVKGPRSYERAFRDTTEDFVEQGFDLDENTKRLAFNFGICLADSERVIERRGRDAVDSDVSVDHITKVGRDAVDSDVSVDHITKVLLIDHEPPIRLLCRVNLEAEGFEVIEAPDGPSGLAKAREELPDVILLDVVMPALDGWWVAERLLEDPATREIPIVFLTQRAEFRDRLRGLELGAVDYVTKPFDPLDLAPLLRELLARIQRGEREELRREKLAELSSLMDYEGEESPTTWSSLMDYEGEESRTTWSSRAANAAWAALEIVPTSLPLRMKHHVVTEAAGVALRSVTRSARYAGRLLLALLAGLVAAVIAGGWSIYYAKAWFGGSTIGWVFALVWSSLWFLLASGYVSLRDEFDRGNWLAIFARAVPIVAIGGFILALVLSSR